MVKFTKPALVEKARAKGLAVSGTVPELRARLGLTPLKARKKRPSRARKVGEIPICSQKKFKAAKCKSPYKKRDAYAYTTYKTGKNVSVPY